MAVCRVGACNVTQRYEFDSSATPPSSTSATTFECLSKKNGDKSSDCTKARDVTWTSKESKKDDCKKDKEEKESKRPDVQDGLPVDKGWAWVIMVANFVMGLTLGGYGCSLSIFFLEFQTMFSASVTTATIVFALMAIAFGVGNLLVTNVLMTSGNTRKLAMTGACLSAVSISLSSISPNIVFLIICHCIMGFSHAMIFIPSITLLGHYFKNRRSLATAVGNTGGSVAAIVFPPLVQYLITSYGARGAILLSGGINMQAIIASFLLRPVVYYKKIARKPPNILKTNDILQSNASNDNQSSISKRMKCDEGYLAKQTDVEEKEFTIRLLEDDEQTVGTQKYHQDLTAGEEKFHLSNQAALKLDLSANNRLLREENCMTPGCELSPTLSEGSRGFDFKVSSLHSSLFSLGSALSTSVVDVCRSTLTLNAMLSPETSLSKPDEPSANRQTAVVESAAKSWVQKCMTGFLAIMNFSLVRNWMFRLILAYQTLGLTAGFIGFYFPSLAVRNGLSREDAAVLITVIGGVDLFSKLSSGVVADLGVIKRTHLVVISLVITSIACHFSAFYTTFIPLALFAVVFGVFGGVCHNLMTVVTIDLLGLEHLGKSMGLVLVVNSVVTTINHPLIGLMVEMTGTMVLPFHYIGVCLFLGAILLLLEPFARRLEAKRMNTIGTRTST